MGMRLVRDKLQCFHGSVADPGFSRGGGVNTPNFPENCMKSKEFGRPGGACVPHAPPLDPPMWMFNV